MELVYKHEKKLFAIAAVISALCWLALVLGTFGIMLVYVLLMYVFFIFAHSVFISYLKGTGVKITAEQYPDLHQALLSSCEKTGVKDVPDAYLLRTDFFNALATRFLGRHFIVLFTDVVDALADRPQAVNFYIGHELGHIHRKHLLWSSFLFPASLLPLLGTALRRAEEYTCDRYGVACCQDRDDVQAALAAIAAGDSRWQSLNAEAYVAQVADTRGFWMSFNELTGDYPWLTKRMASSLSMMEGQDIRFPRRHFLAWLLAALVPRFGTGGAASLMIMLVLIGVLASVAVPQYHDYVNKSRYLQAYSMALPLKSEVEAYVEENQAWPESMDDLGYPDGIEDSVQNYSIDIYNAGTLGVKVGEDADGDERYIVIEPEYDDGEITWTCYGQNAIEKYLPLECQ
ncbi:M48 family metalloprotease [Thalassolituus sp. LLYu03]|uniref:M48 family metalloprotease n=1 Tax=Thalassolituus sp. LLYu03 TaxID=3421656 RepID=UPI003D2CECD6